MPIHASIEYVKGTFINGFSLAKPALDLLAERLDDARAFKDGSSPSAALKTERASMRALIERHGRLETAVMCAAVENMAAAFLVRDHGVRGAIARTLPLVSTRARDTFDGACDFLIERAHTLVDTAVKTLDEKLEGAAVSSVFVHAGIRAVDAGIRRVVGEEYIEDARDYVKALPVRVVGFSRAKAVRVYVPCRVEIERMRRKSRVVSIALDGAIQSSFLGVMGASAFFAFTHVYVIRLEDVAEGEEQGVLLAEAKGDALALALNWRRSRMRRLVKSDAAAVVSALGPAPALSVENSFIGVIDDDSDTEPSIDSTTQYSSDVAEADLEDNDDESFISVGTDNESDDSTVNTSGTDVYFVKGKVIGDEEDGDWVVVYSRDRVEDVIMVEPTVAVVEDKVEDVVVVEGVVIILQDKVEAVGVAEDVQHIVGVMEGLVKEDEVEAAVEVEVAAVIAEGQGLAEVKVKDTVAFGGEDMVRARLDAILASVSRESFKESCKDIVYSLSGTEANDAVDYLSSIVACTPRLSKADRDRGLTVEDLINMQMGGKASESSAEDYVHPAPISVFVTSVDGIDTPVNGIVPTSSNAETASITTTGTGTTTSTAATPLDSDTAATSTSSLDNNVGNAKGTKGKGKATTAMDDETYEKVLAALLSDASPSASVFNHLPSSPFGVTDVDARIDAAWNEQGQVEIGSHNIVTSSATTEAIQDWRSHTAAETQPTSLYYLEKDTAKRAAGKGTVDGFESEREAIKYLRWMLECEDPTTEKYDPEAAEKALVEDMMAAGPVGKKNYDEPTADGFASEKEAFKYLIWMVDHGEDPNAVYDPDAEEGGVAEDAGAGTGEVDNEVDCEDGKQDEGGALDETKDEVHETKRLVENQNRLVARSEAPVRALVMGKALPTILEDVAEEDEEEDFFAIEDDIDIQDYVKVEDEIFASTEKHRAGEEEDSGASRMGTNKSIPLVSIQENVDAQKGKMVMTAPVITITKNDKGEREREGRQVFKMIDWATDVEESFSQSFSQLQFDQSQIEVECVHAALVNDISSEDLDYTTIYETPFKPAPILVEIDTGSPNFEIKVEVKSLTNEDIGGANEHEAGASMESCEGVMKIEDEGGASEELGYVPAPSFSMSMPCIASASISVNEALSLNTSVSFDYRSSGAMCSMNTAMSFMEQGSLDVAGENEARAAEVEEAERAWEGIAAPVAVHQGSDTAATEVKGISPPKSFLTATAAPFVPRAQLGSPPQRSGGALSTLAPLVPRAQLGSPPQRSGGALSTPAYWEPARTVTRVIIESPGCAARRRTTTSSGRRARHLAHMGQSGKAKPRVLGARDLNV